MRKAKNLAISLGRAFRQAFSRDEEAQAQADSLARVIKLRKAGHDIGDAVKIGVNVHIKGAVRLGDGVQVGEGVVISGNISIGERSRIEKFVEISGNVDVGVDTVVGAYSFLSTMPAAQLKIGSDVLVNAYSVIGAGERVEIGNHCIFAAFVHITDSSHGIDDADDLIKHAKWTCAPVTIAENVWLGSAVMVTMGSTIGPGSVIGAKALVNSVIPALSIAYGIPARVMRNRLDHKEASP